jgi:methylmalonyl-CoA mutase
MLSTAVLHLRMFEEARQPLIYAAEHIGFSTSIDQDQFLGVAKIRALRRLWQRVQAECGVDPVSAIIHAETSYRMMTVKDPETNILRTTIANFAAVAGGADSVSILPFTIAHGLPDPFARRVARNTQLVLAGESNIGYVADPAIGSGSVEQLTDELSDAAWREFQAIEAEGGNSGITACRQTAGPHRGVRGRARASIRVGKTPDRRHQSLSCQDRASCDDARRRAAARDKRGRRLLRKAGSGPH